MSTPDPNLGSRVVHCSEKIGLSTYGTLLFFIILISSQNELQ